MVPLDFHKKKVLYYICLPFQETLKLIKGKMQFYRDALLRTSVNMGKGDIMIWGIWERVIYRYGRRSHTTNMFMSWIKETMHIWKIISTQPHLQSLHSSCEKMGQIE